MKERTALVAGATGLIGSYLINFLLQNPLYKEVRILTRHKLHINNNKLQEITVDFDRLDAYRTNAIFQVDDVFCSLGTTIKKAHNQTQFRKVDYEYPLEIARYARSFGAQQFLVVSAIGASTQSPFFYNRVKGELEEALSKLNYPALHLFRPSLLLGKRKEFRMGEWVGQQFGKLLLPAFVGSLRKYKPVKAETVAMAMMKAADQAALGINIYDSDKIYVMGTT